MPITFTAPHPLFNPASPNPFLHVPHADHIPLAPGVYIVGVKIKVSDYDGNGVEKFCPMVVGQTTNLTKRIMEHRTPHRPPPAAPVGAVADMNKGEELFDFINKPINVVYQGIHWWNLLHWNWVGIGHTRHYAPFVNSAYAPAIDQDIQKFVLYNHIKTFGNSMIYFTCPSFFDFYLNLAPGRFPPVNNHSMAIAALAGLGGRRAIALMNSINAIKNTMEFSFYYSYAEQANWIGHYPAMTLDEAEAYTKSALESINIFTYQRAIQAIHNQRLAPLGTMPRPINAWDIDLSAIQNVLVNITGSPFPNPLIIGV